MPKRYGHRQLFKYTLSFMNVKVLYERITLNNFTSAYTLVTVLTCIVLVALQAVTYADNTQAINRLTPVVRAPIVPFGIPIRLGGKTLHLCPSLYDGTAESCRLVADFTQPIQNADIVSNSNLSETCVVSLMYLDDVLHDSRREDVVTFIFQFWMLSVSLFAIVAQSIPHLSAAFLGHVLGFIWAVYRLTSTKSSKMFYEFNVVPKACSGVDLIGTWWNQRITHDTAIMAVNVVVVVVFPILSFKLYQAFTAQAMFGVTPSTQVASAYKLFLFFSATLQLTVFYSLASTGMWIDKVDHSPLKNLAVHSGLYLAGFIVTLIFQVPWLLLGFATIRYEGRNLFLAFLGISGGLLILFTVVFFSDIYLYAFLSWPFFAVMTMTSYVLLVLTTVLAVVCRLRFGRGLAEYLNAKDELEAADFDPVNIPISPRPRTPPIVVNAQVDTYSISDAEKSPTTSVDAGLWNSRELSPTFPTTAQFPSQVDTGAEVPPTWSKVQQASPIKPPSLPPSYATNERRGSEVTLRSYMPPVTPAPSMAASRRLQSKWSISTDDDLMRRSLFTATSSSARNTTMTTWTETPSLAARRVEEVPQLPKLEISTEDPKAGGDDWFDTERSERGVEADVLKGDEGKPSSIDLKLERKPSRLVGDPF